MYEVRVCIWLVIGTKDVIKDVIKVEKKDVRKFVIKVEDIL